MAISGDTILVGAPSLSSGARRRRLRVRPEQRGIDVRRDTEARSHRWTAAGIRRSSPWTVRYGRSLVTIVASQRPQNQGVIFIYTRSGSTFVERQQLSPSDAAAGDQFGVTFDLEPGVLVAGLADRSSVQGRAYVFSRSADTFTETQRLTASDGFVGDVFGSAVAVSAGNILVRRRLLWIAEGPSMPLVDRPSRRRQPG